jgi:colicin import membrane protein
MTEEEKKIARAAELDAAIKAVDKKRADEEAEAGKALDKKLSSISDAVKGIADSVAGLSKRMDVFERGDADKAKPGDADAIRKRVDDVAKELAAKKLAAQDNDGDGDDFDDLPETEQAQMVEQELAAMKPEEREYGEDGTLARRKAADAARKRHSDSLKTEGRYDRERRHENLRADAWARADNVYGALGMTPSKPMPSEAPRAYRQRLARAIQRFSPAYKEVDLKAIKDPKVFSIAEDTIYADANKEAAKPSDIAPGRLRMVEKKVDGHTIRSFHGEPRAWMNPIAGDVQLRAIGSFKVPGYHGS